MLYIRMARRRFCLFQYRHLPFARCSTCGLTWLLPPRGTAGSVNNQVRRTSFGSMRHHRCVARGADE